jgi:hypothetical protein
MLNARSSIRLFSVGAWRRPVAHLHGVQGVGGSNPLAPTNFLDTKPPLSTNQGASSASDNINFNINLRGNWFHRYLELVGCFPLYASRGMAVDVHRSPYILMA